MNTTVTGTIFVLLLSSLGQPVLPLLAVNSLSGFFLFLVLFVFFPICLLSLLLCLSSFSHKHLLCWNGQVKSHLLPQPVNRKGGLLLLRPVAPSPDPVWRGYRSDWRATQLMHPEPVQRCHLRHPIKSLGSRAYEELCVSFYFLHISLVLWWLESLHCSLVLSLPSFGQYLTSANSAT